MPTDPVGVLTQRRGCVPADQCKLDLGGGLVIIAHPRALHDPALGRDRVLLILGLEHHQPHDAALELELGVPDVELLQQFAWLADLPHGRFRCLPAE